MADKVKVAILGGGCGAIAAAYGLTSTPELQARYDVTVYQMGWRLGGKGASGRNMDPKLGKRIEEHGLHVWAGFYTNAFAIMKACYTALNGQGTTGIFPDFDDAFKPHTSISMQSYIRGEWYNKTMNWPANTALRGEPQALNEKAYAIHLAQFLADVFQTPPPSFPQAAHAEMNAIHHLAAFPHITALNLETILDAIKKLLETLIENGTNACFKLLVPAFSKLATSLQEYITAHPELDANAIIWGRMIILVCCILVGMAEEDVITQGFDVLNQYDLTEFIGKHGANEETLSSTVLRGGYDYVFGFIDGNLANKSLAAGVGLHGALAVFFGFSGAILWKMQAGMGDTIFTPLYKLLQERGVEFKFFHKVTNLHLENKAITSITMDEQVEINGGAAYQPFVSVKGLDCWPSTPFFDQLAQGEALKSQRVNLESHWTDWVGAKKELLLGQDYDEIVLGISIGAFNDICPELNADPSWQAMVDNVKTVRTFGTQLWMKPTLQELGFPYGSSIATSYIERLSTYADMANLLPAEDWPASSAPQDIAYFCGALADDPGQPNAPDPSYPIKQTQALEEAAVAWIKENMRHFWPEAYVNNTFYTDFLYDQEDSTGDEKFANQYFRVNIDPSERYVLSDKNSIKYRMPADGAPFDNLFLAGDWVKTTISAGCVEAAMEGGLAAAKGITAKVDIMRQQHLADSIKIANNK
ncbi:MAG: hypothetical protein ACI8UP_004489 [Porticoccaceae bacterium]|jgi:uncharacterized protein with NAD-binding domain and iron-sulfur cluster